MRSSERGLAAILFTEIVGYTALMGESEERALAVREVHSKLAGGLVRRFGGRLIEERGDETLSTFPSTLDAVNCALSIRKSLGDHETLRVRMGIHVGDVVFRGEGIYGDAVNLASRIRELAEPNGICVSAEVYQLVRNQEHVRATSLGDRTLKNVSRPVGVFSLEGTPQQPQHAREHPRTPDARQPRRADVEPRREVFVGRREELAELEAGLESALSGRGRLFLVAGEPGIGKTSLAEELTGKAARRGARVLWGRCWEGEGAPPFWPWVQIIRAYVEEAPADTLAARMGTGAAQIAQIVREVRERLPDLAAAPPADAEQARFLLFDAVTVFLKNVSREAPLVLLLDDLHWADKPSLLLLHFLAREMAAVPLFVIATYRDVEVTRGHPLSEVLPSLRHERIVGRVLLHGLSDADVRTLLSALRGEEVSEEIAGAVFRETEGHPFYIREILRHLIDEGILYRDEGRWVSRLGFEKISLPESIREVVGRRLERLSPSCREILQAASVIGREFGVESLARLAKGGESDLLVALEEAEATGVIHAQPRSRGRHMFSHALVRETLYEELRSIRRLRLHREAGEALEALYASDPEPHVAELAHHFLESLPGGDVDKAVDYAVRAARQAKLRVAFEESVLWYERALEALELKQPPDDLRRCELLLALGEATHDAYGTRKAAETFQQAAALAERLAEPELFARAGLGVAGLTIDIDNFADPVTVSLLEKALRSLDERDGALRAMVMAQLAGALAFSDVHEEKIRLARDAIAMARRVGDPVSLAYVLSVSHSALWGPDNLDERVVNARELIELGERIGDGRVAGQGRTNLVAHLLEKGDIDAVYREAAAHKRVAKTSGEQAMAGALEGLLALFEGRFGEVEEIAQRLLGLESLVGPQAYGGQMHFLRLEQGRLEEVVDAMRGFLDNAPTVLAWRAALAWTYAELGRHHEARIELERFAADDFAPVPREMLWLLTMWELAETVVLLEDVDHGEALYRHLLPYEDRYVAIGPVVFAGSVARSLGCLATLLSRFEDAERHFERALVMEAKMRSRPWRAHAQYDYARMLVRRNGAGDRGKAEALGGEAIAIARELGMIALERKILALGLASSGEEKALTETGAVAEPASAGGVFRQDGDVWVIAWEGASVRLRDSKGLQYIARLLARPGEELHVADIVAGPAESPDPAGAADPTPGRAGSGLGDAGEVLDPRARAEYKARLDGLRSELEEAESFNDRERATRLREEIDFLGRELSAAVGLGGRSRKAADAAERARKAVTSRIRETVRRIRNENEALGLHLENSIRTGIFCAYRPERQVEWITAG